VVLLAGSRRMGMGHRSARRLGGVPVPATELIGSRRHLVLHPHGFSRGRRRRIDGIQRAGRGRADAIEPGVPVIE
jgi:hypothetical protein